MREILRYCTYVYTYVQVNMSGYVYYAVRCLGKLRTNIDDGLLF